MVLPAAAALMLAGALLLNVSAVSKPTSGGPAPGELDLRAAAVQPGQGRLPLRHLRRPGLLGRRAAAAQGDRGREARRRRARPEPEDRAGRRSEGRRQRASRRGRPGAIKQGKVDLDDPTTTLALLKLNAVVGVKGFFNAKGTLQLGRHHLRRVPLHGGRLVRAGDRPAARRLGQPRPQRRRRSSRWPQPQAGRRPARRRRGDGARRCSPSWGPGKFDAELFLDGKAFRPDGKTAATLIPPAFGLAGVNLHTTPAGAR